MHHPIYFWQLRQFHCYSCYALGVFVLIYMAIFNELPNIFLDIVIFALAFIYLFLIKNPIFKVVYSVTFGGLYFIGYSAYLIESPNYVVSMVPLLYFVIAFLLFDRYVCFNNFISIRKNLNFVIYWIFFISGIFGIVLHEAFYYVSVGVFSYIAFTERRDNFFYCSLVLMFVFILLHLYNWSGFGRLNIVSSVLVVSLSYLLRHKSNVTTLKSFLFFCVAAFSTPFLSLLRFIELDANVIELSVVLNDSAFHHLILFPEIFYKFNDFSLSSFLEQIVLFFLNWFPRTLLTVEMWSSKPIGIGYYFVDLFLSRETTGEGFSVSVGFIGELFSYLQNFWFLGYLFYIYIFILLFNFFSNFFFHRVWLLYTVSFLPSWIWGGAALYGSRVWWFAVPFVLSCIFLRVFNSNYRR